MKKYFYQTLGMLAVLASRFGFFLPNFSVVGSYGFFGQNIFLFFGSIIAFDLVRGGFYPGWIYTYVGFLSYFLYGYIAKNSYRKQALLLPLSSFTFFLVSNFGVFWGFHPHTLVGLAQTYIPAIPFYQNTLMGDLLFGYGFLAVKYLVQNYDKTGILAIENRVLAKD